MAPLACTNATSYGSGIAPTAGCVYNVMSTCNFTGEYATASGAVSGSSYVFIANGTGPAYITVRQGTSNGTVLGEGFSPVTVTCTASGNLYAHFNSDAACGTASLGCITSRIGCTSCTGPTQYCAVTSTNTAYGIKTVTTTGGVGNINNTTGSGTYTDYSATMFVSQYVGTPVNFTVTPVSASSHGYGLWIDWNNNKCFEPGTETIKMSGGYISGNFTGTITIPAGTAAGNYRMRVVNNYLTSAPTACGDLGSAGYGEAEDYTFRVLSADPPSTGGGIECLLVCSNNQTITLAPGACNANVNYLVTTIGPKCTQKSVGPTQAFSQLTSFPTNVDDALDCGLQDAKHSRAYPARTTDFYLNGIDVASWSAGQQRVNIFKYTGALNGATLDRSAMTLLYQSPFFNVPGGQQKTHYNFAAPVLIPANTKYVVEQEKPAGSNYFIIAAVFD